MKKIKITIDNKTTEHSLKQRKEFAPSIKIVKSKKVFNRKKKHFENYDK